MSKSKNINFIEFPKPNNKGDGTNIQFSYSHDNSAIFMTMAKQINGTTVKDARFDYKHKIIFKLNAYDICEFIKVFKGKAEKITNQNGDGLLHRSGNTTSIVNLKKNDPKYGGFFLSMQKDDKDNDFKVVYSIRISGSEAYMLNVLFDYAIIKMHKWGVEKSFNYDKKDNNE